MPYILPLLAGLALLPIPLLRDLHLESAMVAGTIGCFWAGIRAATSISNRDFFTTLRILGFIYLAAIPLFFFALISGCLTLDGFGFWIFIPFPSAFFGAATGRLIRKFKFPFPKTLTISVLLFCAIGIWMIEFFNFPQVYFYNHIWGIWPGPIYDESVTLSGSFFYFRWLTFLWIVLLWVIPDWSKTLQTKLITGFSVLSLMLGYINLDEAGIISPRETIQQQLGGHHQTEHFEVYYDEGFYTEDEIKYWSLRHEFHFQQITEILEIDWPEGRKIESYLYAHAWQKKKITGAKFTSYVPLWLEQDQLHIAKKQLDEVLKHELVHVISKQFGNDLFNGSWSIGLIEGLAEGIAKDASPRSTLHQIVAAEKTYPTADEMESALSFWGFYRSAGAISYTTAGSFVEYLLNNHPVNTFKNAYRFNDFEQPYPVPFDTLVHNWHQALDKVPLDSVDQQVSEFIFSQRSLFQKPCPHSSTQELRLWDKYRFQLANKDTASGYKTLDELYHLQPENALVKDEWVRAQLLQGNYSKGEQAITPKETLLDLQVLKADALFLMGHFHQADSLLEKITPEIESSPARNFAYTLPLRKDSLQWSYHIQRRYLDQLPDSTTFSALNLPNQMLSLNKALQQQKESKIILYASLLSNHSPHMHWFDIYEDVIRQLPHLGYVDLAERWVELASSSNLRLRYAERLKEEQEWVNYIKNDNLVAD